MNIAQQLNALFSFHGLFTLLVLSALELVLGVDNIIFISLVITKIPQERRFSARATGLAWAFVMRVAVLFIIVWISQIAKTLFMVSRFRVSVKDVLFFAGGIYLFWNTARELIHHLKGRYEAAPADTKPVAYRAVILQIVMMDLLFSFDSIFTAIGLIQNLVIMTLAVACGMIFMLWISGKTSEFINRHPAIKTLALSFILLVGADMLAGAAHYSIPEVYLYAALGFAVVAELINMRIRHKS